MFEKILYATDFSDASARTLEFVKRAKDMGTKEVVVLNVVKDKYFYLMDEQSRVDLDALAAGPKNDALKKLDATARELAGEGFKVEARLARGVAKEEILKTAQRENISLIVLGSHGKGFMSKMILGSVSESVIRKSDYPVLIVAKDHHQLSKSQRREKGDVRILPRPSYQAT